MSRNMNFVNSKHSPGDSFLEELAIAKTANYFLTTSEINWLTYRQCRFCLGL